MEQDQPEKKWNRWDVNPETGLTFWTYNKMSKNGEHWVTAETAEKYLERKRVLANETYHRNRDAIREKRRAHYKENREQELKKRKKWASENRHKILEYQREKRKTDAMYALKADVRIRVWQLLKQKGPNKRKSRALELIGCTWETLKEHIERQFAEGMSWENRSDWHIDHIIPLSSAKDEDTVMKLFHYTNLQPLWAIDNLKKGHSLDWQQKEA
jgi:hypothetical protein